MLCEPSDSQMCCAQSAQRRPREDKLDVGMYDDMFEEHEERIYFPQAPQTIGQKLDEQAALGWKTCVPVSAWC